MVQKYEQGDITDPGTGLCAGEPDSLVVIADPERKPQDYRADISGHHTGCSIDPSTVLEDIHPKTQEETYQQKEGLVSDKMIEDEKEYIEIGIDITEIIDIVQNQDLDQDENDESSGIGQDRTIHLGSYFGVPSPPLAGDFR